MNLFKPVLVFLKDWLIVTSVIILAVIGIVIAAVLFWTPYILLFYFTGSDTLAGVGFTFIIISFAATIAFRESEKENGYN